MELGKKDLDILIEERVRNSIPSSVRNAAMLGFLAIIAGGLLEISGKLWGFTLLGAGFLAIIGATFISARKKKQARKEMREYYESYHRLPPWPEEANESRQPDN